MAIITLSQWKTLTNTTTDTYDVRVTALIPYIQADFVNLCNFDFYQGTDEEEWPTGCELDVATMITYKLNKMGSDGEELKSESFKEYSYTRGNIGTHGYPESMEKSIQDKWRHCGPKFGSYRVQYRDKRGLNPKQLCERVDI